MDTMHSAQLNEGMSNRLEEVLSRVVGSAERVSMLEEMTRANANRILGHEPEPASGDKMPERGLPDGTLAQIDDMLTKITRGLDQLESQARRFNRL
jgi:hypothetical protein